MLKQITTRRTFIKAPFPVKNHRDGPVKFEKNFPVERKLKAWERDGQDKETWFKRKHAHHHARDIRENGPRIRNKREQSAPKPLKTILHHLSRDPLYDYIYGKNSVMAAMQAERRQLGTVYLQNGDEDIESLAKQLNITIEKTSKMELNNLTKNAVHNGVVLKCRKLEVDAIQAMDWSHPGQLNYRSMGEEIAVEVADGDRFPFVVYLDELTDPHNVGAIMRTAYFLGADMVLMSERNCAPLNNTVSKVSAGAMEFMNIGSVNKPLDFVERSKTNGWKIVSADSNRKRSNAVSTAQIKEMLQTSPVMLLVGSEGEGIRTSLLNKSDGIVTLGSANAPLGVDSLNVSVATGIILGNVLL